MPDGSNVRKRIVDVLHRLQIKLLRDDEGDTKSFRSIINVSFFILFFINMLIISSGNYFHINIFLDLLCNPIQQNPRARLRAPLEKFPYDEKITRRSFAPKKTSSPLRTDR